MIAPVATVVRLPKSHDAVEHCCFPGVDLSRHTARGFGLEFPGRYDSVTIVPLSRRTQLLAPSIGVGHLPGPLDRFPPSAPGQPPGFATPQGRCLQGGSRPWRPGAVPGKAMVASCQCQAAPGAKQEPYVTMALHLSSGYVQLVRFGLRPFREAGVLLERL